MITRVYQRKSAAMHHFLQLVLVPAHPLVLYLPQRSNCCRDSALEYIYTTIHTTSAICQEGDSLHPSQSQSSLGLSRAAAAAAALARRHDIWQRSSDRAACAVTGRHVEKKKALRAPLPAAPTDTALLSCRSDLRSAPLSSGAMTASINDSRGSNKRDLS